MQALLSARRLFMAGLLLGIALLSGGCALFRPQPPAVGAPRAQAVILNLRQDMEQIGSFKGIARFTQTLGGVLQSGRAAYGAAPPGSLRVEVLNPFGQSMISLASDGAAISIYMRNEDRFLSGRASRGLMNKALGIPLSGEEMIPLLAGRVPVVPYSRASIKPWRLAENSPGEGWVVELKSWLGFKREKIFLAQDAATVIKAEMYSGFNKLSYSVFFEKEGETAASVTVLGAKGDSLGLRIQRFWENTPVDASQFVLTKDMVTR